MKKLNAATILTIIVLLFFVQITIENAIKTLDLPKDYLMIFFECLFGIFAIFIPYILGKFFHLHISSLIRIIYTSFLFFTMYLGVLRGFYLYVPHWDTIMHLVSGVLLNILAFSMIHLFNGGKNSIKQLTPIFIVTFTFCFSVTIGSFWELFEFFGDCFLHTNLQRFADINKVPFTGQTALLDTMKDIIADITGSFFMSIVGFISLKNNKGWIEKLIITSK